VAIRICTIGVPRFVHDGFEAVSAWREFDFAKASEAAQQAFLDYHGQFVQVHPDDGAELARAGLEYFEERGRRRLRRVAPKKK
jgi:hypothetical protein